MAETVKGKSEEQSRRLYRAIWRWHFYAGVFCIPFVIWLSITGSIYLFRPQIERWLDRPYDHLHLQGPRSTPEQIARAAVVAIPHSSLHYYELPPDPDGAARVVVGVGKQEFRVYLHPVTRQILYVVSEDMRPMTALAHLHGQLLVGRWGSSLVELAASWAIVMLLTGLFLWWPRQTEKLAGVIWVRLGKGRRVFWRDLHAITGAWISAFALFLILTGLPWANNWGDYFKLVRKMTGTAAVHQDWTTGRAEEVAARVARDSNALNTTADTPDVLGGEHAGHGGPAMHDPSADPYSAFDRLVPLAASLGLANPIQIVPAAKPGGLWTIQSDSQNRTLRHQVEADPKTGAIAGRLNFNQKMLLDRIVLVGIAIHEGAFWCRQSIARRPDGTGAHHTVRQRRGPVVEEASCRCAGSTRADGAAGLAACASGARAYTCRLSAGTEYFGRPYSPCGELCSLANSFYAALARTRFGLTQLTARRGPPRGAIFLLSCVLAARTASGSLH